MVASRVAGFVFIFKNIPPATARLCLWTETGSNLRGQCFSPASCLHLMRQRVRSLKCVVRALSCQTFWRVRLIARRLPGLFVWYISNKLREAYHFSSSISYSQSHFLKMKIRYVLPNEKNITNVVFTDYSGRGMKPNTAGKGNSITFPSA